MDTILAFCMKWHITNSDAFAEIFTKPLSRDLTVRLLPWDGKSWDPIMLSDKPVVFLQYPPHPRVFSNPKANVTWVPMWDDAAKYSSEWWQKLPKQMKIIAYSSIIAQKAHQCRLQTMEIRYYPSPETYKPVDWAQEPKLFYWNRRGIISPAFLDNLCRAFHIKELILREQVDPYTHDGAKIEIHSKLGNTTVIKIKQHLDKPDYLKLLHDAHIFIAPRAAEGVGVTFIEALIQGSAVFGYDAPTMNEYIEHKKNGFLLSESSLNIHNVTAYIQKKFFDRLKRYVSKQRLAFDYKISDLQNWREIKSLDIERLGKEARMRSLLGHKEWQSKIPSLVNFIVSDKS